MNNFNNVFVITLTFLVVLSCSTSNQKMYVQEPGQIIIEAESFSNQIVPENINYKWNIEQEIKGYMGDGYVISDPKAERDSGRFRIGEGPVLEYEIDVLEAGMYYTGLRGYASTKWNSADANDSGFITVDGKKVSRTSWKGSIWEDKWHYAFSDEDALKEFQIELPKGKVTIELHLREPGTIIDQIILVKSKKLMPTDDNPFDVMKVLLPKTTVKKY